MDFEIHYEPMLNYVEKIRKADSPLGILLNIDFLTDLLDFELKKGEVLKKHGIKTQMERDKYRERLIEHNKSLQMHRLWDTLRAKNSTP